MTKMSKAQRIAIVDFHNGVTGKGCTMLAEARTIAVLIRNGWATFGPGTSTAWALRAKRRAAYVTRAGLIAAGVDMDAIHAEALAERPTLTAKEMTDRMSAEGRQVVRDAAHAEAMPCIAAPSVVLNETVTDVPDYDGPWRGQTYITHHLYGEQLHRTLSDAERWNRRQQELRPAPAGASCPECERMADDAPVIRCCDPGPFCDDQPGCEAAASAEPDTSMPYSS